MVFESVFTAFSNIEKLNLKEQQLIDEITILSKGSQYLKAQEIHKNQVMFNIIAMSCPNSNI